MFNRRRLGWLKEAACFENPDVPARAWLSVTHGFFDVREGAEAMLVCLSCPVKAECRKYITGYDLVAGNGWYQADGTFCQAPEGYPLDTYMAMAYLGVSRYITDVLARSRRLEYIVQQNRRWFTLDSVKAVAEDPRIGPAHGSEQMQRIHRLRNEPLCVKCSRALVRPHCETAKVSPKTSVKQ